MLNFIVNLGLGCSPEVGKICGIGHCLVKIEEILLRTQLKVLGFRTIRK